MKSPLQITRRLLTISALMLLAGCVSHPSSSAVQPWPGSPPAGYAMLMIYAPQHAMGHGPSVYIDDTLLFKLKWTSYTWVYVRAGRHSLEAKRIFGVGDINGHITLAAGNSYYLKSFDSAQNYVYATKIRSGLYPVSEQTAKKEAATCWFQRPLVLQFDSPGEEAQGKAADHIPVVQSNSIGATNTP